MLKLDDFKRITLDDKKIFDKIFEKYPANHSDYLFTTMISWIDYGNYEYLLKNDNIIIKTNIKEKIFFRLPIGTPNLNLIKETMETAKEYGSEPPITMVDEDLKNYIANNIPKIKLIEDRKFFDYVYLSKDLAELKGSAYGKIRNRLNKFKNNFEYKTEIINEKNMPEVAEFLKRWCLWRDCESDELLENERKAILYSMAHFFELKLSGLVIRINNEIEAIAVFEKMNEDTVVVHYEKGSPDYDGIYKAINNETAIYLQDKFKFINRESDMGQAGLRQAKMSYRPEKLIKVYHIKKVDINF